LIFLKIDVLFSVIPFIFRPIWVKKYIFNPRGNFELEKKKIWWKKYKILTITSFKFFDKWKWILNLWNVVSKLWKKTWFKIW